MRSDVSLVAVRKELAGSFLEKVRMLDQALSIIIPLMGIILKGILDHMEGYIRDDCI